MSSRVVVRSVVTATCVLTLALYSWKFGSAEQKVSQPVTPDQPVNVVLPAKPVGKNLVFGIYWTSDLHNDPKVSLSLANGIVTVVGDISYCYELGETISLKPGDTRKIEATIPQEAKAVVLKVLQKWPVGEPASDPANYSAFLIDAQGHALASKEFFTIGQKGDSFNVPLVYSITRVKPGSIIRLVIKEANTNKGIVIPMSVRSVSESVEEGTGDSK